MGKYAKVALIGQCQGQEVVNILYFTEESGDPAIAADPAERAILGAEVMTTLLPLFAEQLSNFYTTTEIQVSCVNEANVYDPYTYTVYVPAAQVGVATGAISGAGECGIVGFQCSYPFAGAPVGLRVPKKSYLAYGPMVNDDIDNDGAVLWSFDGKANIAAALTDPLNAGGTIWLPIRIGVDGPNGPAIGKVDGVIFRPYKSSRESREVRPNGR